MWTARTSSSIERPTLTAWIVGPVDAVDRHDDPLLPLRGGDDVGRIHGELALRAAVLAADEQHHPDEERDEDHDEVRAVDELLRHDDRQDDRRSGRRRPR